jgi:hypothetical protein
MRLSCQVVAAAFQLTFFPAWGSPHNPYARDLVECVLVHQGKIASAGVSGRKGMPATVTEANVGHVIVQGGSPVFAYRRFHDDGSGVDAAMFEKGTWVLQGFELSKGKAIQTQGGTFTAGGVGFLGRGDYWHAKDVAASISFRRTPTGLEAKLHAEFEVRFASSSDVKVLTLDSSCVVVEKDAAQLSAWEGRAPTSHDSFAPRN